MSDPDSGPAATTGGAMTFQGYLRIIREQRRLVVTVIILAVLGSAVVAFLRPPEFTARLTLYAAAQSSGSESSAYQAGQLAAQRVASYQRLVRSTRVATEVVDRLDLEASPDEISERIDASSPPESVLLELSVTGPSPESAAAVASALGAVMTELVAELEKPAAQDAAPAITLRVVVPATVPNSPSSPSVPVILAIGVLAGVALAAVAALARSSLDTSIKSPQRLSETTGAAVLAVFEFDRRVRQHPLAVARHPHSPMAETFRQLRTKLRFLDLDGSSKVYVITSALPLEGKTTTLCNTAIALGSAGIRTLIIEADLRQPTFAEVLQLDASAGLSTVATGQTTAEQAIQTWRAGPIDVLPSGPVPPCPSELLTAADIDGLLTTLRAQYDVILIDTPPLLPVSDAATVAPHADGTILVCRFGKLRQAALRDAMAVLEAVSAPVSGTVLTMLPSHGRVRYARYYASRRRAHRILLPAQRTWHKTTNP